MKSLKYMSLVALVAGLTACSQYEEPNPSTPVTPQETVMEVDGVTLTSSQYVAPAEDGTLATIDLDAYNKLGFDIPMADVTTDPEFFPSDYTIRGVMYLAKTEDFDDCYTIDVTPEDGVISVTADQLQAAFETMFGRKKDSYDVWVRYALYADSDLVKNIRLSNNGSLWFGTQEFILAPIPPSFVVEEAYYLLGTVNGWSVATAIKLDHSDQDVYDDPNFTGYFDITDSSWWWKVIPQSTYETGDWVSGDDTQFGPVENGDHSLSGLLTGTDPGAGEITTPGKYVFHINIENLTYEFTEAYEEIHVTGNGNGWSPADPPLLEPNAAYTWYEGLAYINGDFKFTYGGGWDVNWGVGDTAGELVFNAGNISDVSEAGIYSIRMSPVYLEYEVYSYKIETLGIIGGFNGWASEITMTPNADYTIWTATGVGMSAGDEFKIRANDAWDWSLGGNSTTDLIFQNSVNTNTPNITAPNGGNTVTLDLSKVPFTITIE